jgi:N-acetyl-gamma-glutamyl-phosphate reductase
VDRIKVSVIGASGYGGAETVRLLATHPLVQLVHVTAETKKGAAMSSLYPNLRGFIDQTMIEADLERIGGESDVTIVSLPSGMAMGLVPDLLKQGTKVIDVAADFRLKQAELYPQWYKLAHTAPEYLGEAVYGLSELHRDAIARARLVADPGCYPAAAILALAPLLRAGKVRTQGVVIDAKSGVSGAGRGGGGALGFSETNENVKAYSVVGHNHTAEIEQELSGLAGTTVQVVFTPHLIPMTRGILVTAYAPLASDLSEPDALALYQQTYAGEPFVRVLDGVLPETKATLGSNFCDVAVKVNQRAGMAIAIAAIDNLGKGAAGQAVQNMNLMCGLEEETGLKFPGVYP